MEMSLSRRTFVALAATAALAACEKSAAPPPSPGATTAAPAVAPAGGAGFKSVDITGAEYARALSLQDADGRARTLADFKGKVVVVFFGFTQCPDICPTTMLQLAEAKKLLGADGDRVQGVFVTVDPERDSAAVLKEYVNNFGAGFVALRGTPDEVAAAAREFKVFYRKAPGATPESYTIDHTAASFVFDPQGRVRLYVRHTTPTKDLASDLKQLLG
jgi:protein SCO1